MFVPLLPIMPNRRHWLVASAAVAVPGWLAAAPGTARPLVLTPSQTEGPFYPPTLPSDHDADLLRQGALAYTQGQPVWVHGEVIDPRGMPVRGAVVEIWQCDAQGRYHHPGDGGRADPAFQGFGRVAVGADGRYRFRTLRPAPYAGRTPHIHFKVRLDGRELLTTQMYVQGDPGNAQDFLWRRLSEAGRQALTVAFERGHDGVLRGHFPLVVSV